MVLKYKGVHGSAHLNQDNKHWFGVINDHRGLTKYQAKSHVDLVYEFYDAVERHLKMVAA